MFICHAYLLDFLMKTSRKIFFVGGFLFIKRHLVNRQILCKFA